MNISKLHIGDEIEYGNGLYVDTKKIKDISGNMIYLDDAPGTIISVRQVLRINKKYNESLIINRLETIAHDIFALTFVACVVMVLIETVLFTDGIAKWTDVCIWIMMAWLSWAVPSMYDERKQIKEELDK